MLFCLFNAAMWSPSGKGAGLLALFVWSVVVFCHFPVWCPGSGVVIDCIDS